MILTTMHEVKTKLLLQPQEQVVTLFVTLTQYNAVLDLMEETFVEPHLENLDKENLPLTKASSFKTALTNIAYNLKNNCIFPLPFASRVPLEFSSHERVYLLGKAYDQSTREDFYNAFEKIIWFSYRRLSHCEDVGWGCMIRVIQMLVAEAISRDQTQLHPDSIIDWFREEKSGPLALSKICKAGHVGPRWTSCPEILSIISSILSEMKDQKRIGFSFQIFCDKLIIDAPHQYKDQDFPKVVTIHTKIGEGKTIPQAYIFHLLQLGKDKRFIGMASGQNNQALYVVGTFQKLAIILDPHYVQQQQLFSTFFCKNPQGIEFTELANGVSISFYIPSFDDFQEWIAQLLYANRLSAPYSCFSLQVKQEEQWITTRRKGSDDFQLL